MFRKENHLKKFGIIEMKSKPSTSTAKDDDAMETEKKPETSKEVDEDKGSRGQKRKSEDASSEETPSKKVQTVPLYYIAAFLL
jgi:hypothetical protein